MPSQWRVLDAAHKKRNLAEYEGFLEVEEFAMAELCALAEKLITQAGALVDIE
jgi:hypothetical protein